MIGSRLVLRINLCFTLLSLSKTKFHLSDYDQQMKRGIPSLNWLPVFAAAARPENFALAADLLNMSTSAVSRQVKPYNASS
jgi:hypothetical protein